MLLNFQFSETGLTTWSSSITHVYKRAGNYTVDMEASNAVSGFFWTYTVVVYGMLTSSNGKRFCSKCLGVYNRWVQFFVLLGRHTQDSPAEFQYECWPHQPRQHFVASSLCWCLEAGSDGGKASSYAKAVSHKLPCELCFHNQPNLFHLFGYVDKNDVTNQSGYRDSHVKYYLQTVMSYLMLLYLT